MNLVKRLLLGVVILIAILIAIAYLLPNQYGVTRSILISAHQEKIFPLLVSPKEWSKWSTWNRRDPNMKITFSGPPMGTGAEWSWKSKSEGNGGMKFIAVAPDQAITYALHLEGMGKPSTGVLLLESQGPDTKVTWSMHGTTEGNLIFKLFVPFMDKFVGKDFEEGLKNLKEITEKT